MSLFKAQGLCLAYEGENVVTDLEFEINKGDYLCIVGENGSGKSTLVKALLGLKKTSGGSLLVGDGLKQNQIGYLPQQTPVQRDFPASVYEVVLSGNLGSKGFFSFYTSEDKQRALLIMEKLGISELKNKCYRKLSGGQQQRVLLARALCATKSLLLLDEPVTGLDPSASAEMYGIIKKLNAQTGITVVMVSHDIRAAMENAKTILHLHNKQLFFGSVRDYARSDAGKIFFTGEKND